MNTSSALDRFRLSRTTVAMLCAALLATGTACNDSADTPAHTDAASSAHAIDSTAPGGIPAGTDSTKLGTPAPATAELAVDSIPLRTPDGGLARYGIESGRIIQQYVGNNRGTRVIMFDRYGMRERREEKVAPYPEGKKGLLHNVITIMTPESQTYVDIRSGKGKTKSNDALQRYIDAGAGKTKSLGEIVMEESDAEHLPDTTIAGYHCRVLRKHTKGMIVTKWIWRGIALQEHFLIPEDTLEYSLVPVEITPNAPMHDSLFRFSDRYKITPYVPKKKEK